LDPGVGCHGNRVGPLLGALELVQGLGSTTPFKPRPDDLVTAVRPKQ
jgi:hypothetical protein